MDSNRSIEDAREDELPPLNSASAAQLREVLTQLGPAFVKIGQAIASRPDLLPPAYQRSVNLPLPFRSPRFAPRPGCELKVADSPAILLQRA